jgi:hypothetical protein
MSLENAASLVEIKCGRRALLDFVAVRFQVRKTLWQHAVLPFLNPLAVFTTNYDELIETGWQTYTYSSSFKPITPIFDDSQGFNSSSHVPLYKPHGSVAWPNRPVRNGGVVITQFDYFEILNARREMLKDFMSDFATSCVIFIGYSFMDSDIASHLYELRRNNRDLHWYAVFPRNDANVRNMFANKYGIMQINRRFHDFLADLDREFDFIPRGWKFRNIKTLMNQKLILEDS